MYLVIQYYLSGILSQLGRGWKIVFGRYWFGEGSNTTQQGKDELFAEELMIFALYILPCTQVTQRDDGRLSRTLSQKAFTTVSIPQQFFFRKEVRTLPSRLLLQKKLTSRLCTRFKKDDGASFYLGLLRTITEPGFLFVNNNICLWPMLRA